VGVKRQTGGATVLAGIGNGPRAEVGFRRRQSLDASRRVDDVDVWSTERSIAIARGFEEPPIVNPASPQTQIHLARPARRHQPGDAGEKRQRDQRPLRRGTADETTKGVRRRFAPASISPAKRKARGRGRTDVLEPLGARWGISRRQTIGYAHRP